MVGSAKHRSPMVRTWLVRLSTMPVTFWAVVREFARSEECRTNACFHRLSHGDLATPLTHYEEI
jgi:hypothetical protein